MIQLTLRGDGRSWSRAWCWRGRCRPCIVIQTDPFQRALQTANHPHVQLQQGWDAIGNCNCVARGNMNRQVEIKPTHSPRSRTNSGLDKVSRSDDIDIFSNNNAANLTSANFTPRQIGDKKVSAVAAALWWWRGGRIGWYRTAQESNSYCSDQADLEPTAR